MYSPALFSDDRFNLWGPGRGATSKKPRVDGDDVTVGRHLFAPPMQAYSTDQPGASMGELDYTIQSMANASACVRLTTPSVQRKLDQLSRIRTCGYTSIRPIGVNKTMEEIQMEHGKTATANDTEEPSFHAVENTNHSNLVPEHDLDAQVENIDGMAHDDDVLSSDDGFMADDVEYQDDHSLNEAILESAPSATFSYNLRSGTTVPTTTASGSPPLRSSEVHDENGNENGNENDDMDMTMDD